MAAPSRSPKRSLSIALVRATAARELTRQRVAAGVDNRIQLKQGDAEVASAEQQMALARRAVESARSSLSVLLGKGPDRGLEITRPQTLRPAQLAVPADLPVALIGHRADLVAAGAEGFLRDLTGGPSLSATG